jgi:tetratricopeptide (TPR) repeat protein
LSGAWSLVLAVLGVGLAAGLLLAWRLRGREREADASAPLRSDLADLEGRQEELIARLRGPLEADEREAVETEAARNLRALERLRKALPDLAPGPHAVEEPRRAGAPPAGAAGRRPVAAFLAGAAVASLVGWLVVVAQRDARPRPGADAATAAPGEHPEGTQLSAGDRERLAILTEQVAANPEDLAARKRYALALLGTGQFFGAFRESQEILRRLPADTDGLYVQGVVRLQMGQDEAAVELLDQVLAQYPEHVLALTAKGVALHRVGNTLGARLVWQQALAASGGSNPQIEELLAVLEERAAAESEPAGVPAPAADAPPAGTAAAGPSYRVRVELATGAAVPPGATLFVVLRGDAPGPPAAVKRIATPVFPLEVDVTSADSMLGQPLPAIGTLGVRLDADGDASTRSGADLAAETPARSSALTTLRLGDG